MKKYYLPFLFAFVLVGFTSSCTYDNTEDLYNNFPDPCDVSAVSYSMDIKAIIQEKCAGCHSGPSPSAGKDWTDYSQVAADKDKIRNRINRPEGAPGRMPAIGTLTQCEIDQLNAWIDMGALNN